ncbi:MAG: DUF3160 domain-containing protein [Planctomycetes bacterium]|nr:DUF3160 domain-containing protein [Planctomycetota bacterium]
MNERSLEQVVRTAEAPARLAPHEEKLLNAIAEEQPMVIAPAYPSSAPRLPVEWLAYAAAVALFAALLWGFSVNRQNTPPQGAPAVVLQQSPGQEKPDQPADPEAPAVPKQAVVERPTRTGPGINFAGSYPKLADLPRAAVPQYALPLKVEDIANADKGMVAGLLKDEAARELLLKNGFVVLGGARGENVAVLLDQVNKSETPVVVTPDCVLHVFHICFDETLKDLEEQVFHWDMFDVCQRLLEISDAAYRRAAADLASASGGEAEKQRRLMEAWRLNVAFLAVPTRLLGEAPRVRRKSGTSRDPYGDGSHETLIEEGAETITVPPYVEESTRRELELIEKHEGFRQSAVFDYVDDFSQYVPRGHYTRTELLKRYFKAMMYLGRATFLVNEVPGRDSVSRPGPGQITAARAITPEMAERMTLAAALMAEGVQTAPLGDRPRRPAFAVPLAQAGSLRQLWERVYSCTGFFVGVADDLSPAEYVDTLKGAQAASLADREALHKFMQGLRGLALPRIYGGTGQFEVYAYGEAELRLMLEKSQGMRLMGQRFVPDSDAMGKLVFPTVRRPLPGDAGAKPGNLTYVAAELGPIRGFPRGLDVMALMGSRRAREILAETRDDGYDNYEATLAGLKQQWDAMTFADWQRNLYMAWLYTLKPLLEDRHERRGFPTFMQTQAYEDRLLTAALASWAQLRHDTILYAKQSYTGGAGGGVPRPPKVVRPVGYVEPVVEFYERMYALCEMMRLGLNSLGVSSPDANNRLVKLAGASQRLARLSREQLMGNELTQADYDFIKNFSQTVTDTLKPEVGTLDPRSLRTDIIADVHTDGNSKQCLEVGTGKLRLMAIAYYNPDGDLIVGMGPVLSFYEFRHPMKDRLTDEKWQQMLATGKTPPDPEWIKSFTGGK